MNGNETKMALGQKPITIDEQEYIIKLEIDDISTYIKKSAGYALRYRFYDKHDRIEDIIKVSDEINDYKTDFMIMALTNNGMPKKDANELVKRNIVEVMTNIEIWLGMTSPEKKTEFDKLKDKAKNL